MPPRSSGCGNWDTWSRRPAGPLDTGAPQRIIQDCPALYFRPRFRGPRQARPVCPAGRSPWARPGPKEPRWPSRIPPEISSGGFFFGWRVRGERADRGVWCDRVHGAGGRPPASAPPQRPKGVHYGQRRRAPGPRGGGRRRGRRLPARTSPRRLRHVRGAASRGSPRGGRRRPLGRPPTARRRRVQAVVWPGAPSAAAPRPGGLRLVRDLPGTTPRGAPRVPTPGAMRLRCSCLSFHSCARGSWIPPTSWPTPRAEPPGRVALSERTCSSAR